MATLRATINVNANNLTSQQSLSTQIVSNLTVTEGGVLVDNITAVVGAPAILLTAANFALGTKVYLKNRGATHNLYVSFEASGTGGEGAWIILKPGVWTMFPWQAAVNLRVYCSNAAGSVLEYGTFA
tara:strand:+ start:31325 stop:31705 length:381 start_codon:yes stop_codon:yes gene_type:complete